MQLTVWTFLYIFVVLVSIVTYSYIPDRCGTVVSACATTAGDSQFDSSTGQVNVCLGAWLYREVLVLDL